MIPLALAAALAVGLGFGYGLAARYLRLPRAVEAVLAAVVGAVIILLTLGALGAGPLGPAHAIRARTGPHGFPIDALFVVVGSLLLAAAAGVASHGLHLVGLPKIRGAWLAAILKREEVEFHHVVVAIIAVGALLAGISVASANSAVRVGTLAKGADVSVWQGTLPCAFYGGQAFALAKAGGADGGWYQDSQWTHNVGCMRSELSARGSYFFGSPPAACDATACPDVAREKTWGSQQATYYAGIINATGGLRTGEATMLDLETGSGNQDAYARAFLDTATAILGVRPLLYISLGYLSNLPCTGPNTDPCSARDGLQNYPLDLADWYYGNPPAPPRPWSALTLWQWTSSATVAGVYPVDDNYLISSWPGKPAPAPPPPAPAPPPALWHDSALWNASDGYTLDGWGGVHVVGNASAATGYGYWPGWDIARGIAVLPAGTGGVQLDGWGGLHPFSAVGRTPTISGGPYWPGWDIARTLAIATDSSGQPAGGYVLDDWGGLHPFCVNGVCAPTPTGFAYWPGWNIARDLVMIPGTNEGYTLDGWGGIHPFNGAPAVAAGAYWPGWDIARSIALNPDGKSGYVMDGWGGLHPFAVAGATAPATCGGPYWPGWDIARDVVTTAAGTGYVLDGYGPEHPFHAC